MEIHERAKSVVAQFKANLGDDLKGMIDEQHFQKLESLVFDAIADDRDFLLNQIQTVAARYAKEADPRQLEL